MSPPWGTATFPKPGRPDGDKDAGTARRKWTRVHIEPTSGCAAARREPRERNWRQWTPAADGSCGAAGQPEGRPNEAG